MTVQRKVQLIAIIQKAMNSTNVSYGYDFDFVIHRTTESSVPPKPVLFNLQPV